MPYGTLFQSYQCVLQTETEQIRKKTWHLLIGMVQRELIRGTGKELTEAVKAGRGA